MKIKHHVRVEKFTPMTEKRLQELKSQAATLTYIPIRNGANELIREIERLRVLVIELMPDNMEIKDE